MGEKPSGDVITEEPDRVWHNPSLDQIVEALLVALMTRDSLDPLPAEYGSFVLHLIEGYGKLQRQIAEGERRLRTIQTHQMKQDNEMKNLAASWRKQEAWYRAEINCLEMVIHRECPDGARAVKSARAGSLLKSKLPLARPMVSVPTVTTRPCCHGNVGDSTALPAASKFVCQASAAQTDTGVQSQKGRTMDSHRSIRKIQPNRSSKGSR